MCTKNVQRLIDKQDYISSLGVFSLADTYVYVFTVAIFLRTFTEYIQFLFFSKIFRHANDNLSLKDREVKSLRRQLDGTNEDLQETSRSRDIAMRENRRLQDDLTVMSKENQVQIL